VAISKEIETKGRKKPILLKGAGSFPCLKIKLGNLGVELWDFPKGDALPYVRLLFEPAWAGNIRSINEPAESDDHLHVDLDVMQAGALSVAIEQWLLGFESETRDGSVPSLHMQIATLTTVLYPQRHDQAAKAELSVQTRDGLSGQVVLTRFEASLLGTLIESLADEKEVGYPEFVG
jgi:hypothetical protein